jgi:hypothetical protein
MKELCSKYLKGKAKSHPCTKCKEVFDHEYQLLFHNSTEHSPKNEFKCHEENCNYTFSDENSFKKHSAGCVGNKVLKKTSSKGHDKDSFNKRKTKLIPRLDPCHLVVPGEAPVDIVNSAGCLGNEVLKGTSPKVHEEKMLSQEVTIQNILHQNKSLIDMVLDQTKLFVCQENNCKFAFSSDAILKKHSELVHTGKKLSDLAVACPKYQCKENGCMASFSSQLQIQYHSLIHQRKRSPEQGKERLSFRYDQYRICP